MSKAIVNMTPDPSDIQTIHCSQGDTEAREWEFELHNNGEVIDAGGITEQMVFKSYEGGTEQILPENGSTPTTSPFKGDIKYPQGLLSDQEFLYRESPTEEDGLAWIKNIKGNTLVWKQLVPSLSAMSGQNGTISVADNVATITSSSSTGYLGMATSGSSIELPKSGHKYLLTVEVISSKAMSSCSMVYGNNISVIKYNLSANTWTKLSNIVSYSSPTGQYVQCRIFGSFEQGDTMQVRNWNYFDLTAMGLDSINTIEEFTSLFPLPFYDYNQGTLLSFMGNGIKTVGKNLLNLNITDGTYLGLTVKKEDDGSVSINGRTTSSGNIYLMDNTGNDFYVPNDAVMSTNVVSHGEYDVKLTTLENTSIVSIGNESLSANVPKGWYKGLRLYVANGRDYNLNLKLMIAFDSTEFEPYTSSTLSIPLDEFPNGMDGVNDVRDEKNETGYIKRFVSITFDGSESWAKETFQGWSNTYYVNIGTHYIYYTDWNTDKIYCVCDRFQGVSYNQTKGANMVVMTGRGQYIEFLAPETITSVADWKTWLSNNPTTIKFELAIPLENYGVVDLGSLTWTAVSTDTSGVYRMRSNGLQGLVKNTSSTSEVANIICPLYVATGSSLNYRRTKGIAIETNGMLFVYDENYNTSSSPEIFKQAMSGVYLLYEKQNPQGFTTATLVTENGEVALANENGVLVGKCNSDVSADAGFIEGKIKLSDEDGDVYSNKIQIHVERSPQ